MDIPIEGSNEFGALSPERLEQFEQELGAVLPDEYRAFLLRHNGGYPEGARGIGRLHHVYGLHDGPSWGHFPDRKIYGGLIPPNLLPIADDPFGNQYCISIGGSDRGSVYFWDHEGDPDRGDRPGYGNAHFLASGFQAFLRGLMFEVACSRGDLGTILRGLEDGLDVNAPLFGDRALLDMAVGHEHGYDLVRLLVERGSKVEGRLLDAVRSGSYETVEYLLTRGASANERDPTSGFTPLLMAASASRPDVAKLLLAHGADLGVKNNWGKTAIDLAHDPAVKTLLQNTNKER